MKSTEEVKLHKPVILNDSAFLHVFVLVQVQRSHILNKGAIKEAFSYFWHSISIHFYSCH